MPFIVNGAQAAETIYRKKTIIDSSIICLLGLTGRAPQRTHQKNRSIGKGLGNHRESARSFINEKWHGGLWPDDVGWLYAALHIFRRRRGREGYEILEDASGILGSPFVTLGNIGLDNSERHAWSMKIGSGLKAERARRPKADGQEK